MTGYNTSTYKAAAYTDFLEILSCRLWGLCVHPQSECGDVWAAGGPAGASACPVISAVHTVQHQWNHTAHAQQVCLFREIVG